MQEERKKKASVNMKIPPNTDEISQIHWRWQSKPRVHVTLVASSVTEMLVSVYKTTWKAQAFLPG